MVQIDIEILVPILIALLVFVWYVWLKLSKKYNQWRYNPKNDKGKLGEEHRQKLIKEEGRDPAKEVANAVATSPNGKSSSSGQADATGRSIFPSAIFDAEGERSDGSGKTSRSNGKSDKSGRRKFKNPFKRK